MKHLGREDRSSSTPIYQPFRFIGLQRASFHKLYRIMRPAAPSCGIYLVSEQGSMALTTSPILPQRQHDHLECRPQASRQNCVGV